MCLRDLKFWLNGKCNTDYGIILQKEITFDGAEPNYESQHIPGRNGDLFFWDASYNNVTGTASCYVAGTGSADMLRQRAIEFFFGTPGYLRLETDNEPDVYRMVVPKIGPGTDIRVGSIAPFEIELSAKPEIYLKDGENPFTLSESGAVVVNPTAFSSKPLITVYGNSAANLFVNGVECRFLSLSGSCTLDCNTQDAYKGTENKNGTVAIAEYPVLATGENKITWTAGITSVEIVPRWCYIT